MRFAGTYGSAARSQPAARHQAAAPLAGRRRQLGQDRRQDSSARGAPPESSWPLPTASCASGGALILQGVYTEKDARIFPRSGRSLRCEGL